MQIEITFNPAGNTIVGDYSVYKKLDEAMAAKKHILFPSGLTVAGDKSDILRLADYVLTFGNCLKSINNWKHVCKLAGVEAAT